MAMFLEGVPEFVSPRSPGSSPTRIDLHCHSLASSHPTEAILRMLNCPECYSDPLAVYTQAKSRGMDLVTITDHDSIDGALRLANRPDVLIGEELSCWFPEDGCKMHVLVWGLSADDHAQLQSIAKDIYRVAEYLESHNLAHAVAHPTYRQNDKLERWHLERLLLLFKGFECLNGSHSPLHREAFEPLLDRLTEEELKRLSRRHGLSPRWPTPWIKARTAGSDDHGLLYIGTTWTEFPATAQTPADVLNCLREGNCRPAGVPGSSQRLAHTFYSVAIRYYTRHLLPPQSKPNLPTLLLQTLVGEASPQITSILASPASHFLTSLFHKTRSVLTSCLPSSTPGSQRSDDPDLSANRPPALRDFFLTAIRRHLAENPDLLQSLKSTLPPLANGQGIFDFISSVNRDVTADIADAIAQSIDRASFTDLFNSIAAALAQQFVLLPYYFATFHQNKERQMIRQITNQVPQITRSNLRLGLFTDTLDDINGVSRFLRDMASQAHNQNLKLIVHTCSNTPTVALPNRKNFIPLLSRTLPYYEDLTLNLPPLLDVLQWADQQQFDAIHVSTPGPMGLCGYLVAKMLHVPLLGTYHTDFPAYVETLTGDHRIARGVSSYMQWFYTRLDKVLARSREYRASLRSFGIVPEKLSLIPPSVDTHKFNPSHADPSLWQTLGIQEPHRLLYAGRLSLEKNLSMLVEIFHTLCQTRTDVALIIAGDGPYRPTMQNDLRQLPAHFLGMVDDTRLAKLYASSDLLLFPSRTDTLGQAVLEAQASGLVSLVSDEGGPQELVDDEITGLILPATDPSRWVHAITQLLDDPPRRLQMSRTAPTRSQRHSLEQTFETFWTEHCQAVQSPAPSSPIRPAAQTPIST
ncbi:MAG: glycosyltransferase [Bacillota bacterium]